MKKIFSMGLALSMAVALLCNPVMAERQGKDTPDFGASADVKIMFDPGDLVNKYYLDVEFENMKFVYHEGSRDWDPEKHEYDNIVDGAWEGNGGLTMVNHSDQAVKYSVTGELTVETYGRLSIVVDEATKSGIIAACAEGAQNGVSASTEVSGEGKPC